MSFAIRAIQKKATIRAPIPTAHGISWRIAPPGSIGSNTTPFCSTWKAPAIRPPTIPPMTFMAHEAAHLGPATIEAARRRSRIALFLGVAVGSTGHLAALTVAAIAGNELLGSVAFAGAPGAAVVFGAAMGAL